MRGLLPARLRHRESRRRAVWLTPQVYLFAMLFPVIVAASLVWFVEQEHPAAGNPVQVEVTGDPGTPATEFFSEIDAFSQDRGVAVALFTADLGDPSRRVLHVTAPDGTAPAEWVTTGYPGGVFATPTNVTPLSDAATRSAAGMYLVYGTETDAEYFTLVARKQGYAAGVQNITPGLILTTTTPLLYALISCWILAATALVASTVCKGREYAITRFWGATGTTVVARELAAVARYVAPRLGIVAALGITAATATGNWAGLNHILTAAGPYMAGLLAGTAAVHATAVAATFYLPDQLAALRGNAGHTPVMSLTYAARLPVVFLLAFTLVGAVNNATAYHDTRTALADLGPAGTTQRLAVSGLAAQTADEQDAIFTGVGTWLTDVDRDGDAVITQPMLLDPTTTENPVSSHPLFADGPVPMMLVNNTYLTRHHITTTDGTPLTATPTAPDVIVAVPAALEPHRATIEATLIDSLDLNVRSEHVGAITTTPAHLADGLDVFTYGAQEFSDDTSHATLHDPILVVVPNTLLAPAFYASLAGQGGILFTHPDNAITHVAATPDLAKYVRWIQPPATPILRDHRENLCNLTASLLALAFLATALLLTSLAVSLVYRTDQAHRTRVRALYGWSLWRTCRLALAWETALAATVLLFFATHIPRFAPGEISPDLAQHFTHHALLQLACGALGTAGAAISLIIFLHRAYTTTTHPTPT